MKTTVNNLIFVVLAVVGGMAPLVGNVQGAEKEKNTVTISVSVQEQIQKASTDERKKMEAAISVGNKFIPHHFDGSAYEVGDSGGGQELRYWLKNVRPLVNRDEMNWYNDYEIASASKLNFMIDGWLTEVVAVCPQVELVSVVTGYEHLDIGWETWYPTNFAEDEFVLKYRARIIGAWGAFHGFPPKHFLFTNKDEFETVLISVDKNNKINQVFSQYAVSALTTKPQIKILTLYISGAWSDNATAADKARLRQLIPKIEEEEVRVCASTAAVTNRPSNKE